MKNETDCCFPIFRGKKTIPEGFLHRCADQKQSVQQGFLYNFNGV